MIVVMREGCQKSEVDHIVHLIREMGLKDHVIVGTERTVVAVIGDDRAKDRTALETLPGVDRVVPILAPYKIASREVRDNTYTAHARGECKEGEHHHDQPHSHADIVAALHDCQVVLCGGMGWRAAEELQANGIRPVAVDAATAPEQAVQDFLDGELKATTGFCRCHE